MITFPAKCGLKLLFHFQISTWISICIPYFIMDISQQGLLTWNYSVSNTLRTHLFICFLLVLLEYVIMWHTLSLRWRHNGHDSVSNHQPQDCLLNRIFGRISKKTSKLRVTGLCAGNSPVTGEFPAQMASYAENDSIWWRHHVGI